MFRSIVASVAALFALPAIAPAQFRTVVPNAGFSGGALGNGLTGGIRPLGPAILPAPTPIAPPRFSMVGRGSMGGGILRPVPPIWQQGAGFPFSGVWPGYGYGGWAPFYQAVPVMPMPVIVPSTVPSRLPSVNQSVVLANQFPAVLTMEFPGMAEVWLNGEKVKGDPSTEWTLTSPRLQPGGTYTFEVKAKWTSGGRMFTSERSITVAAGNRSRSLVVTGTEVK